MSLVRPPPISVHEEDHLGTNLRKTFRARRRCRGWVGSSIDVRAGRILGRRGEPSGQANRTRRVMHVGCDGPDSTVCDFSHSDKKPKRVGIHAWFSIRRGPELIVLIHLPNSCTTLLATQYRSS